MCYCLARLKTVQTNASLFYTMTFPLDVYDETNEKHKTKFLQELQINME